MTTTSPVHDAATELLSVRGLNVSLGSRKRTQILHGADFSVARGEIVGLIGETGSGKTTLARSILGLAPADSGSIRFKGDEIAQLKRRPRKRLRLTGDMQYVFQDPLRSLDPDNTIGDSVIEGLAVAGNRSRQELDALARDAFRLVSLDEALLSRYPSEISGGQRQRVAIARAMVLDPDLLICDEPVSALDATNRILILDLLRELRQAKDIGVLLITHDLGSLAGIADRVSVLYHGRIVESGTTDDIFLNPQHPYTKLLVASVPSLFGEKIDPDRYDELRREVAAAQDAVQ
jgi:ABC-type glutathione transport system ATPase component